MRGRSYTPSPPRGYGRRGRSPSPRGRNGGLGRVDVPTSYGRRGRSPSPRGRSGGLGRGDAPTSLLVRNLRHDCRPEYLRKHFGEFGTIKDVYLPRDYHTGQPRGFGFVQYLDPADALDAKHQMDGEILQGRELTVVFAEENRKKPTEMRSRGRGGRSRTYDRRRSLPRSSRSPRPSRSPPLQYGRARSHSHDYYSSPKRRYSRSVSPHEKRYSGERSNSLEGSRSYNGSRSLIQSPVKKRSPYGSRSCSQSPGRGHLPVGAQKSQFPTSRSSRSPYPVDYSRKPGGDGTPRQTVSYVRK